MNGYKNRVADRLLAEKLEAFGAVLIEGPKYCGKTTLASQQAGSILSMADTDTLGQNLALARTNISRLLAGETPRLIDEWQIAPQFWDAVRNEVDKRNEDGQFMLTGSAVPPKPKKDENGNIIPHGAEHTHEHSHEDGHTHTHPHTHEHGHEDDHHHDHEHGCEGSCDTGCSGCSGAAQDPKAQLTALLGYMLNHNESHARELDEMAGKIAEAGMPEAAEQIRKGVAEFQKGNMYLSLALSMVKEDK